MSLMYLQLFLTNFTNCVSGRQLDASMLMQNERQNMQREASNTVTCVKHCYSKMLASGDIKQLQKNMKDKERLKRDDT